MYNIRNVGRIDNNLRSQISNSSKQNIKQIIEIADDKRKRVFKSIESLNKEVKGINSNINILKKKLSDFEESQGGYQISEAEEKGIIYIFI